MTEQYEPGIADLVQRFELLSQTINHRDERLGADIAFLKDQMGSLVTMERYTIEHAAQEARVDELRHRVATLETARETLRNMVLSALALPIVAGILLYLLTDGSK